MAGARRIPPLIADYLVFVLLLLVRFGLDVARFPVDGYARLTPVAVIETQVFYIALHYAIYLLLRANLVPVAQASRVALVTIAVYLYLHLLEFFFYAGGRADGYAPAGHLLDNLLSAFLATGDAGFWQIMRIFVCGAILLLYLLQRRGSLPRIGVSLLLLYLWGMLLVHPDAWLFAPERSEDLPQTVLEQGVLSFIISAWCLLLITLAARIERWLAEPGGLGAARYAAGWVLGLTLILLWQPMLTGANPSVSFLLLQCAIIVHLAVGMTRLDRLVAALRTEPRWERAADRDRRDAEPAGAGTSVQCMDHPLPSPGALILGGDLVRILAALLAGAILASVWGLAEPMFIWLVIWMLIEGLLVRPRWRRTGRHGALFGLAFGALWLALSPLLPAPLRAVDGPLNRVNDYPALQRQARADQRVELA